MLFKLSILKKILFLTIALLTFNIALYTQSSHHHFVEIDTITVQGNLQTNTRIILRELNLAIGDQLPVEEIEARCTQNEFFLMNSSLFTWVEIDFIPTDSTSNQVQVEIKVQESWYIYPIPILSLADRNFNVWWKEYERSSQRVNFGVDLAWSNFTGNRDELLLVVQYGFTQKYELDYTFPFINNKQTLGLNGNILYSRNKEVNYQTLENRQQFYKNSSDFIFKRFRTGLTLTYRPHLFRSQDFGLRYQRHYISQAITQNLNPNFFLQGKTSQRYFSLFYTYSIDRRDIKPYPLTGHYFHFTATKSGLGFFEDLNTLILSAKHIQYIPLSDRFNLEWTGKLSLSLIRRLQPFYNNRALGYQNDYIRGYEFYVIDGEDYAYTKADWRFQLFNDGFNWGKIMFIESLRLMPLKLYFKVNMDAAYVNQSYHRGDNLLSNRGLYGGGLGLDIVAYYSNLIQLNYSINHLGEHGFFLHWQFGF